MSVSKAERLYKTDQYLGEGFTPAWEKYHGQLASDATIERTIQALEGKGHKAQVVNDSKAALAALLAQLPDGAQIFTAGSTTLEEIGFIDYLKANSGKYDNLKEKLLAAQGPDAPKIRQLAMAPQIAICSVPAVSETGDFTICDLTGTRVTPVLGSEKAIFIVGTQKIVKDYVEAAKRTHEFCQPLESARAREVYKVPGSFANFYVAIRGANPMGGQGKFNFIFVKEPLGF